MVNFFNRRTNQQQSFKTSDYTLKNTIKDFQNQREVINFKFDDERNEGFIEAKAYFISFELHNNGGEYIVMVTTTCRLPFGLPQKRSQNFLDYIARNT